MAKIVAAYIAQGRFREARRVTSRIAADLDPVLIRSWQRLYCLFRILKRYENPDHETQFILFTDHAPPHIGSCLIGRYLERLGVKIVQSDFYWRPDLQPERPDFFIFDTIEQLATRVAADDQILLFGPQALVVHDVADLFGEIDRNGVLLVEASVGEVSEPLMDAYRAEIGLVRQEMKTPNLADSILAIDPHFLGLSGEKLADVNRLLRRIFPKNELRAVRGEAFLSDPGEVLAAILAELGFHKSNLKGLTDEIAAMPDEFDVASLPDVPVIIPGYGREPDIVTLYETLRPDKFSAIHQDDTTAIARSTMRRRAFPPMPQRLMDWWSVHRSA